jgi:hypothetical protein
MDRKQALGRRFFSRVAACRHVRIQPMKPRREVFLVARRCGKVPGPCFSQFARHFHRNPFLSADEQIEIAGGDRRLPPAGELKADASRRSIGQRKLGQRRCDDCQGAEGRDFSAANATKPSSRRSKLFGSNLTEDRLGR